MDLKSLFFVVPVMIYYFIESLITAAFVSFVWRFLLAEQLNTHIGYFQWVGIIWIAKVLLFDIFKTTVIQNDVSKNNENNY
jgi:hypothetical protein